MPCLIHLAPVGVVGTPNGRWFLTSAPGCFSGTLGVYCDGVNFSHVVSGLPDDAVPLDQGICPDPHDIYVELPPSFPTCTGDFVFTFVSPATEDASSCDEEIPCGGCATYTLTAEEYYFPEETLFEICQSGPAKNLFTLAGVSCNDYTVDYAPGSPEDTDFDLASPCGSGLGDFNPADIEVDTYTFRFTRIGSEPNCEYCTFEIEIQIIDAPFTGYNQEDSYCIT